MRESLFKDLPRMTADVIAFPMALEERTFILNERMKDIGRARTRIDGRIVAAEKRFVGVERITVGRKSA
jgi:hypothetical protein